MVLFVSKGYSRSVPGGYEVASGKAICMKKCIFGDQVHGRRKWARRDWWMRAGCRVGARGLPILLNFHWKYQRFAKRWFCSRGHEKIRSSVEPSTQTFESQVSNHQKPLEVVMGLVAFCIEKNSVKLEVGWKTYKIHYTWGQKFGCVNILWGHCFLVDSARWVNPNRHYIERHEPGDSTNMPQPRYLLA